MFLRNKDLGRSRESSPAQVAGGSACSPGRGLPRKPRKPCPGTARPGRKRTGTGARAPPRTRRVTSERSAFPGLSFPLCQQAPAATVLSPTGLQVARSGSNQHHLPPPQSQPPSPVGPALFLTENGTPRLGSLPRFPGLAVGAWHAPLSSHLSGAKAPARPHGHQPTTSNIRNTQSALDRGRRVKGRWGCCHRHGHC